jgi:hypothetical protein
MGFVYIEYTEESIRKHIHLMPEILEYLSGALEQAHEMHEKTLKLWEECG